MVNVYHSSSHRNTPKDTRIRIAVFLCTLAIGVVIFRLGFLMLFQHGFYTALAVGAQDISTQLFPKRGEIYIQDSRTEEKYPLAMNRDYFLVFADTRKIETDDQANKIVDKLAEVFSYTPERKLEVYLQLNKRTDPYEPIEQKIDEAQADRLRGLNLLGIGFVRRSYRYYPEGDLGSHVVGFVRRNAEGGDLGQYGIEGYWQKELAGSGGLLEGKKDAKGNLIPLAGTLFNAPKDGADITLTIDRTLQYKACERLKQGLKEYEATSAALIIMDPKTGAIRAMCSVPDFDPNTYGKVSSVDVYNNTTIFTPYEPGSVFKPFTMSAAINEGLVTPDTLFNDTGEVKAGCSKPIHNANDKAYGMQTMTGVLENSINTGVTYVVEKLGKKMFNEYVKKFGFGDKEGIELAVEVEGNISSLTTGKQDGLDCYTATGAFGQGLTVTPLQLATAISAIANGGMLMKPYIVDEIQYSDGRVEKTAPKELRRVMTTRTASLVRGMMASVVDRGQSRKAQIPGYYVGGKTGTAQIAGSGGYTMDTNHSFVGFVPVEDPEFVMVVKFEKPARAYADGTASPIFADVGKFALEYYHVPPGR